MDCASNSGAPAIEPETGAAKAMLERQRRKHVRLSTLGADKGYHTKDFVAPAQQKIAPHIAMIKGRRTPGLDQRTTRHAGYAVSQASASASRRSSVG